MTQHESEALRYLTPLLSVSPPTAAMVASARESAAAFLDCYEVQIACGHLLFLACCFGHELQVSPNEVQRTYRRAVAINPAGAEPWLKLGILADVQERSADAEECFRRAIALDGPSEAYAHLARILAKDHRRAEALLLLAPGTCPFADTADVGRTRREIAAGQWTATGKDAIPA